MASSTRFHEANYCLTAVSLGTMYWFFYGTAFVMGLLEIIAGELWTGVTRFIAVSVKTFVLCLGAAYGLHWVSQDVNKVWMEQSENCGKDFVMRDAWFRLPLYVLCSASCLGQYRFPIVDYWKGLVVQVIAYEVQFRLQIFWEDADAPFQSNIDSAASNLFGATAAVIAAVALYGFINFLRQPYYNRILQREKAGADKCHDCLFGFTRCSLILGSALGLVRKSDRAKLKMSEKLQRERSINDADLGPASARDRLHLTRKEEEALIEAIVDAENPNIWAILMPAVYMLVPGSMIAKLWLAAPPTHSTTCRPTTPPFLSALSPQQFAAGSTPFSRAKRKLLRTMSSQT